jgi:hypothetical protein
MNKKIRPGGEGNRKVIELGGKFYDSLDPPEAHKTKDGDREYIGKELDKDTAFSRLFWEKDQPEGLKEAMKETITRQIDGGKFFSSVGSEVNSEGNIELDQDSKEKLSAYRVLANEMGYEIGPYDLVNKTTVEAKINKIESD